MRFWVISLLLLVPVSAANARTTGPIGMPQGLWRAQINWIPLDTAGHRYLLHGNVCRPIGEAPARVVVIAHGSPPSAGQRPRMNPFSCDSEAAQWFLRAVVLVSARAVSELCAFEALRWRQPDPEPG